MRGESAGGLEGLKEERIFYRSLQKRSSLCSRRIKLSFDGYWPITAPASRKNVDDSRARADRELTASLPSLISTSSHIQLRTEMDWPFLMPTINIQ